MIETVCSSSTQYQLTEYYLRASILKADVHAELGNLSYPLNILKKIEECGELANTEKETQAKFYSTKGKVLDHIVNVLLADGKDISNSGLEDDAQELSNQIELLQAKSIKLQL